MKSICGFLRSRRIYIDDIECMGGEAEMIGAIAGKIQIARRLLIVSLD